MQLDSFVASAVCIGLKQVHDGVLKAKHFENKTTSVGVTTYFKKLTTRNNVFIVSDIV